MRVDTGDGPDLDAVGRALKRRKLWLVVPVVLAVAVSLGQSFTADKLYRSFADIRLPEQSISLFGDNPTLTDQQREDIADAQADLLSTVEVSDKVDELLGPGSELIDSVSHRLTSDSILRVFVTSPDPRLSQAAADAYTTAYIEHLAARSSAAADEKVNRLNAFLGDVQERAVALESQLQNINGQIAKLDDPIASKTATAQQRAEYATLTSSRELLLSQQAALRGNLSEISLRIDQLRADAELQDNNRATVQRKASFPDSPSYPTPLKSALLAAAIGGLLGLAAMYLREATDSTVHAPRDFASSYPEIDILGTVEQRRLRRGSPNSVALRVGLYDEPTEDFRDVRARFTNRCIGGRVLVADVYSSRKRPSIVADLALTFAAAGRSVAAVDANLRSPSLHDRFGIDNSLGISTVLNNPELPPLAAVRAFKRNNTTLALAVAGPPTISPADALDNPTFEKMVTTLSGSVEYVFVDAPPLGSVSDALIAARTAEFTILVVRLGVTTKKEIDQARHDLERAGTVVLGTVLVETVSRVRTNPPPVQKPSFVPASLPSVQRPMQTSRATTPTLFEAAADAEANAWVSRLVTRRSAGPDDDPPPPNGFVANMTMRYPPAPRHSGGEATDAAIRNGGGVVDNGADRYRTGAPGDGSDERTNS